MSDDYITIEVDGKSLTADKGQMLIEVTDANDIYIPRFCYHPKLSVAANCRMCLVEVEKAPKPLPACATPVNDGMVVKTRSALALDSQKSVMEFLLINHPLDCPICDQGGECELQDLAMGYGSDVSRYQESKRVVKDKDIGPLVQTDMTRCIHCTRCVRFGEEIAGLRELGATGRGEHMEIGTYIEKSMQSELSGNVIDVCPVGALTSKPFRFSARSWEMKQGRGIAPHDCVGSNLEIHTKGNIIKRVVPAENALINEVWISDRDRYSYEALYAEDRLQQPQIKRDGQWQRVSWQETLEFVAKRLTKIKQTHGAESIGALTSPSATLEELHLMQSLMRAIGSNNIDHRLQQVDFSSEGEMPAFPSLGCSIADLEDMDTVLLVNSYPRVEQPMINHRLRKAALKGAKIMTLDSEQRDYNYTLSQSLICKSMDLARHLAAVLTLVTDKTDKQDPKGLDSFLSSITDQHKAIAENLLAAKNGIVLLGQSSFSHPQFSILHRLTSAISNTRDMKTGFLSNGANTSGAWLAGAVPHRSMNAEPVSTPGLNTQEMLESQLKSFILFNLEPEHDLLLIAEQQSSISSAELTIAFSAYESTALYESADVLLPIALFAENEGSYINIEGSLQSFKQLVSPPAEVKPGWKILRALAEALDIKNINYNSFDELHRSVCKKIEPSIAVHNNKISADLIEYQHYQSVELPNLSPYSIDPLLRRAISLQQREANA